MLLVISNPNWSDMMQALTLMLPNKSLKLSTNAVADLHSKILDVCPPPRPNSFNFMQFWGKFDKIVCWPFPGGLAPPPRGNPGSGTETGLYVKHMQSAFTFVLIVGCFLASVTVEDRVDLMHRGYYGLYYVTDLGLNAPCWLVSHKQLLHRTLKIRSKIHVSFPYHTYTPILPLSKINCHVWS